MHLPVLLMIAATPPTVSIPDGGPPATCAARARLAATVALTPEVRVVRGAPNPEAPLPTLDVTAGPTGLEVRLSGAGADRTARATDSSQLLEALRAVWIAPLGPAPSTLGGGPNHAALVAACAKDPARAYALAGAAVSTALTELAAPPARARQGTLLERWAWARAQISAPGGCRAAQSTLRTVSSALERGHLPPTWRRPPGDGERPTAITRVADAWILFGDGGFVALDPSTGRTLWRRRTAAAEPHPVELAPGRLGLVTSQGLTVIETRTGTAAWQAKVPRLAAEVAAHRGLVFAASGKEVLAFDADTGEVRWRFDGLSRPAAGPIVVGGRLVVPLYSRLVMLDPKTGALRGEVELGDEITAPLVAGDDRAVWAAVGADEIVRVDVRRGAVEHRASDLFGAAWPPAVTAGRLVASTRAPRGFGVLAIVDPDAAAPTRVRVRYLRPPVLPLADFSGVVHALDRPAAIVARDFAGKERWRARQPRPVRSLSAPGDLVVAGVGRRVVVIDRIRGKGLWQSELEANVLDVRYDQEGGVVALDNGALYGLPGGRDPRVFAALRQARLDLAQCQLDLRSYGAAARTAERALARDPGSVDVRRVLAAARTGARSPQALATWLDVAAGTQRADPAHAEAQTNLHKLGVASFRRPDASLQRLIAWQDHTLFALRGGATVALEVRPDATPVSTSPPLAAVRRQDRTIIGGEAWTVPLERGAPDQLFAGRAHHALTATDAAGRIRLLDAETGTTKWDQTLGAPIVRAWPSRDAVLVETKAGLRALDAATGAARFSRGPLAEGGEIHPHAEGWLVREGARLWGLDAKGSRTFVTRLPKDVRGLRVAYSTSQAVHWTDGAIEVLDATRGRRRARYTLSISEVVLDDGDAIALTADRALIRVSLKP